MRVARGRRWPPPPQMPPSGPSLPPSFDWQLRVGVVEAVGDRVLEVQGGPLADGGVPGVHAETLSSRVEEGGAQPRVDGVLRLAVSMRAGRAVEPRRAMELPADSGDRREAGETLARE